MKRLLTDIPLTERESKVLHLYYQGRSYQEIANALGLSQSSINGALAMAASKLGYMNRQGIKAQRRKQQAS